MPGKPGKPELIPFITGSGNFNAYFLVKWTHPTGGAANYYEIRDANETLTQSSYPGSTPEGRYLKSGTIRGGFTWTLKVRGHDYGGPNNPAQDFGPWSDTTSAKAQSPTVSASNLTASGARLTVSNLPATWWYKGDQSGAQCTKVANGTSTADLTGLDPSTEYTYRIYYRSTCTEDSDKASHWDVKTTFTTEPASLTASSVTHNAATLTLGSHAGSWWLKRTKPSDTTCKPKGTTATESLSNLAEHRTTPTRLTATTPAARELPDQARQAEQAGGVGGRRQRQADHRGLGQRRWHAGQGGSTSRRKAPAVALDSWTAT